MSFVLHVNIICTELLPPASLDAHALRLCHAYCVVAFSFAASCDTNLEVVGLHELGGAQVALVAAHARVDELVVLEHVEVREALAAREALVFAYRGVDARVAAQAAQRRERLVAVRALDVRLRGPTERHTFIKL